MLKFEDLKKDFDEKYKVAQELECFLPVHLTKNKIEKNIRKKNGEFNEQYYKWQFLNSFVGAGYCSKDYIGVEVNFPKGNKNSATLKLDAAIFDDITWFEHYTALHTINDESKWDELDWLKKHLLCAIEFKKEGSRDVKGVFNSQLKAYMNESLRNIVFGTLYDEGRLYLFKANTNEKGRVFSRLSNEFNKVNKNVIEIDYSKLDKYSNLLGFNDMISYDKASQILSNFKGRKVEDLTIISKNDEDKLNNSLYNILVTMDTCSLVNQRGYNLLIQMLALKIYDEKHNSKDLKFYINSDEENYKDLTDDNLQEFLDRIESIRVAAKGLYKKILNENNFDKTSINQVKVVVSIVKQFQDYSFIRSERSNLYQLVFHCFASKFSKVENAQFVTPIEIIDFLVDVVNPKHNESIIDPTVGIADFLSVSYVKSNGTLDDNNLYGMDIDEDMVKLATLNMLLNGDGNATIEAKADGLGSIESKFAYDNSIVSLLPKTEKKLNNFNGNWDDRVDGKELKKFDIVLTNPPFGESRAWKPEGAHENAIAQCYELWNRFYTKKAKKIDLGLIFLENAVRILKENGRMAIILSNSLASVDAYKEARKWLLENLRIVAIFDLPANVFAEAGVKPSIIVGYKPKKEDLDKLLNENYQVFSRKIDKVGYEIVTKNKVKGMEKKYRLNPITFEKEVNLDGSEKIDEEFTEVVNDFRQWCNTQEDTLKKLFL